jgi:hypothetical protein
MSINSASSKPRIRQEFHNAPSTKWIYRAAWMLLAIGIIALVGSLLGFFTAHGLLPQGITSYSGFFADHRWALLGSGLAMVVAGTLGHIYVRRCEKKLYGVIKGEDGKPSEDAGQAINLIFKLLRQNKAVKYGYITFESAESVGTSMVPQDYYCIFTKENGKYTLHSYEDATRLKQAEQAFKDKGYDTIQLSGRSSLLITQNLPK